MQEKGDRSMNYAVLFLVAVIAATCFKAVAHDYAALHPKSNWGHGDGDGDGDGEFSFHGVVTSLILPTITVVFFMAMSLLTFMVSGFPLEMLLQILLMLWSIIYLVCLVAIMPWRLFDCGLLGVSVAVNIFYYLKVKEVHQRLNSAEEIEGGSGVVV